MKSKYTKYLVINEKMAVQLAGLKRIRQGIKKTLHQIHSSKAYKILSFLNKIKSRIF